MYSRIEVDTEDPATLAEVMQPSMGDMGQVSQEVEVGESNIDISIETNTTGQLRGATDGAIRLCSLAKKVLKK